MFGLNWISGSIIAAGIVAAAIMFGLWQHEKGETKTALAQVSMLTAQRAQLQDNVLNLQNQLKFEADAHKAADDVNKTLTNQIADMSQKWSDDHATAGNPLLCDAAPAPVLEFAANSMRATSARISHYAEAARLSGDPFAARIAQPPTAARGSWPSRQCDFAQLAIDYANYAESLAIRLAPLPKFQADYNNRVQIENSKEKP